MFQSLTSPFCSSARGPRFWLLYYIYFNYSWINTFPMARQASSTGKSPTCWTNIHAPHNPMSSFSRSFPSQLHRQDTVEMKAVLRNCQHSWLCCHQRATSFFEGDAGAMFTGKNESYRLMRRHYLLIIVWQKGMGKTRANGKQADREWNSCLVEAQMTAAETNKHRLFCIFDWKLRLKPLVTWSKVWFGFKWESGTEQDEGHWRMAGGRYGVARVSFSCCRLEADVDGITPPVSSLTSQPHPPTFPRGRARTDGLVRFRDCSCSQWLMWCAAPYLN